MERAITFLKIGGTLVSAIVTAILSANDVSEVVSPFGLSIQWSLLTFLLCFGFAVWWLSSLELYKYRGKSKWR